jgi:hypothetical protein
MFHSKVVFFIFSFLLPKKLITQERKRMVITIINQGETKKRSKGPKRQKKGEGAKNTQKQENRRDKKKREKTN